MLESLTCRSDANLLSAMRLINENCMGAVFVVDQENTLIGLVTDGDIRRALLKNANIHASILDVVNRDCVFGHEDDPIEELVSRTSNEIRIIPIVDSSRKLRDYFSYRNDLHFPVAIPDLNGNELKYLTDAFLSTWISSQGSYLTKFEEQFANFSDCRYGTAVANGTVALHLALAALDIGPGDEVIIPDLTFAATINAVLYVGATPVIVDIEKDSWCIDPKEIEDSITDRTKAIIPVHVYGQACDMDAIMSLARKHGLKVIEDCAEAHGATLNNRKVGSFGDVGCFSFYANKVITTGEGGMCTTNSKELLDRMNLLKNHGMSPTKKYWHEELGYNFRMTNLQAAIGLAQFERIDSIFECRRVYEREYRDLLSQRNMSFQIDIPGRERITWLACALVNPDVDRDGYIAWLKSNGIDARPFFYPLSSMPLYRKYSAKSNKVAEAISRRGLNLPTYGSLGNISKIKNVLKAALGSQK